MSNELNASSSAIAMLAVSTVPAVVVPKGFWQVTAGTRATTKDGVKKEIPADQRSRSILMPELTPNVSSKYISLVNSALAEVAKTQLQQQWKEEPLLKEVQAALYTEDALLAFAAREAESKRLTKESIEAWFATSKIGQYIKAKSNAATYKDYSERMQNLAATTPTKFTEERALKYITLVGKHEEDATSDIGSALIRKLGAFVEKIRADREEIGDVEEIDFDAAE